MIQTLVALLAASLVHHQGHDPTLGQQNTPQVATPIPDDGPVASVPAAPSPIKITIEPIQPVRGIGGLVSSHPGLAHVDVYGVTDGGTNLTAIRLGSEDQDRPCIVVVADPLAPRATGQDAVLQLASRLLERLEADLDGDLLCQVDWWLVPDPHPDRDGGTPRTARIGGGFLAGWSPWDCDSDPGPWPLFEPESRNLANALTGVPGAAAALILTEHSAPFVGGHLVRHCQEHLGWLTQTTGLDGAHDLEPLESLAASLPALELTAPQATDLGEGLWLVEHDLYGTGRVADSAPPVDLSWTGATVVALARSVTQRGPEREARQEGATFEVIRHHAEAARVDGPRPGMVQRLRWVLRIPDGSAPALVADGERWSSAQRSVTWTAR